MSEKRLVDCVDILPGLEVRRMPSPASNMATLIAKVYI